MNDILQGIASMMGEHWFWGALTLTVLVWYSSVTIYVAIRGSGDIRRMLKQLEDEQRSRR